MFLPQLSIPPGQSAVTRRYVSVERSFLIVATSLMLAVPVAAVDASTQAKDNIHRKKLLEMHHYLKYS